MDLKYKIDLEILPIFLKLIFGKCERGYIRFKPWLSNRGKDIFFNLDESFDSISKRVADICEENPDWYFFSRIVYSEPIGKINIFSKITSIFIDIDNILPNVNQKEILEQFKVVPTVELKISKWGRHLFWVFLEPVNLLWNWKKILDIEMNLCGILPGDISRILCEFSRIPGQLKREDKNETLVNFDSVSGKTYSLYDFKKIPSLSIDDFSKALKIHKDYSHNPLSNVLFRKFDDGDLDSFNRYI